MRTGSREHYTRLLINSSTALLLLVGLGSQPAHAERGYDEYFDAAKDLANQGEFLAAIEKLEQAALVDPNQIDPLLNIGILYGKARRQAESRQAFQRTQERFPNDPRPYYFLALDDIQQDEIGSAMRNYQQATERGFQASDDFADVRNTLAQYATREFTVEYNPIRAGHTVSIRIRGNPGGDDELCQDALGALERLEIVNGRGIFSEVQVEFLRWKENGTIFQEKWTAIGPEGEKDYWITFDETPPPGFPYKVLIKVSEQEKDGGG